MARRRRRPSDMTGTARCLDCGAIAEYPGGKIGTSLVIRHAADCPNGGR